MARRHMNGTRTINQHNFHNEEFCLLLHHEEMFLTDMRKCEKTKSYSKYDIFSLIDGGFLTFAGVCNIIF